MKKAFYPFFENVDAVRIAVRHLPTETQQYSMTVCLSEPEGEEEIGAILRTLDSLNNLQVLRFVTEDSSVLFIPHDVLKDCIVWIEEVKLESGS